jgi:hypothetical protein
MMLTRPARIALFALVGLGPALAAGACLDDGATTPKNQSDTVGTSASDTSDTALDSSDTAEATSSISAGLQANGSIVIVRKSR